MSRKRSTTEEPVCYPDDVPEWGDRRKLPEKLSHLRRKLYQKAKREPTFRCYSLYGLISREDVLQAAWEQVRRNRGASGPDGVTIDQIVDSEEGPRQFIRDLREELRSKTYKPLAVRRRAAHPFCLLWWRHPVLSERATADIAGGPIAGEHPVGPCGGSDV